MPNKIKNILGKKFNYVTVIKQLPTKIGHAKKVQSFWLCKCDCGKEFEKSVGAITRPILSCGCKTKEAVRNAQWTGFGQISGAVWSHIKKSAKNRKVNFDVSIQDAWHQFEKQNGKCALSGRPLVFNQTWKDKETRRIACASLDRIDSSKGYTKDNIQWIHKDFQPMKWTHSQSKFIELCQEVLDHQKAC